MKKLNIKLNTVSPLLYLLISLCSLNFLNGYFYLAFIIFFLVVVIRKGRIVVSWNLLLLVLFGFTFMLFGFNYLFSHNGINGLLKCFLYPISFFIGENILYEDYRNEKSNESRATTVVLIIVFSMAFHGILNWLYTYITGSVQRNSIDIWTNSVFAATRQACLFVLLCGSFFWCFFLQENRLIKALCLLFLAGMVYYNTVIIASRTIVILIIVGVMLPMLLYILSLSEDKSSQRNRILLRVFIVIAALLLLYLVLYYSDFLGFRHMIDQSNLVSRFKDGFFKDKRNVSRSMYLRLIWQYPFGNNKLFEATNRYGHDILLSALNTGGIVSALVLIGYFITYIYQMFKLYKMTVYSFGFRLLVFTLYSVAIVQFALEPILDGEQWFFGCVLMISGMVNYLIKHPKETFNNELQYENTTD